MSSNKTKLPEGWALANIGDVAALSKEKAEPPFDESVKYLSLEHIESNTSRILGWDKGSIVKSTKAVFESGDVLYGKLRPYLNKVCIPTFNGICSTDILVFKKSVCLENGFFLSFLRTHDVVSYANQNMSGVQLPRISFKKLSLFPIPISPLVEQKRIVDVIEKLFVRVNKTKERLDNAAETMKRFRKSVLNAACTGRLTEDWREKNPDVEPASILLKNIITQRNELSRAKAKQVSNNFTESECHNWINVKGFQLFTWSSGKFLPQKKQDGGKHPVYGGNGINGYHSEYIVANPSLVIGRVGANCGNVHMSPPESWVTDNAIYATSIPEAVELKFVYYVFKTSELNANAGGSGQPFVNQKHLNDLDIPLPPLMEQQEIVQRVEGLFELADKIESRIKEAREKVDKLTQSILAKAFRGELVPTEAELARLEGRDYETAQQLLERIQTEKKTKSKVKKRKTTKKKSTRSITKQKSITKVDYKESGLSDNALMLLHFLHTNFNKSKFTIKDIKQCFSLMEYEDLKEAMFDLLDENINKMNEPALSMSEDSKGQIVFHIERKRKG